MAETPPPQPEQPPEPEPQLEPEPISQDAAIQSATRLLQLVSAAVAITPIILIMIAWVLIRGAERQGEALIDYILIGLAAIAIPGSFFVSQFYREKLMPSFDQSEIDSGVQDPERVTGVYVMSVLLGHFLREISAVLGLIVSQLRGELTWVVIFGVFAIAAIILAWPSQADLKRFFPARKGVDLQGGRY